MQRRKGFTLIELLVVIAIIAILAAILFPVFTNAKEKGKQTKCMNNMKQLAFAIAAYTDDSQGSYPIPCNPAFDWERGTWKQRVMSYAKSKNILLCGAATKQPDANYIARGQSKFDHYGMAAWLTHVSYGAIPVPGMSYFGYTKQSMISLPSKTIMIAENMDGDWSVEPVNNAAGFDNARGRFWPYHLKSSSDTAADKGGGGNFVFCDSHVKFMTAVAADKDDFFLWKVKK